MSKSTDRTLAALANHHRRASLHYLSEESSDVVSTEDVTEGCLDSERGSTLEDTLPDEALWNELHHIHLPMLDEAGIVDYDKRSKTLRYRGSDEVEAALRSIEDIF